METIAMMLKTNPLHDAVIADNSTAVSGLTDSPWRAAKDRLGFTPLEVAQLLGRRHCAELLGDTAPATFNVQLKNDATPRMLSWEEFEKAFNITYRRHLTFRSYKELAEAISECPYLLRCRWLVKENHEWAKTFRQELSTGATAKTCIAWIDDIMGYGAFLDENVPAGAFIGEYTGVVRRLYRDNPDHNAYCFAYPTRLWNRKIFAIDSLHEGNITRFFNHSEKPSLQTLCVVDRGLLHQIFVSARPLQKGTQLTFDYGQEYWARRDMRAEVAVKSRFRDILDSR